MCPMTVSLKLASPWASAGCQLRAKCRPGARVGVVSQAPAGDRRAPGSRARCREGSDPHPGVAGTWRKPGPFQRKWIGWGDICPTALWELPFGGWRLSRPVPFKGRFPKCLSPLSYLRLWCCCSEGVPSTSPLFSFLEKIWPCKPGYCCSLWSSQVHMWLCVGPSWAVESQGSGPTEQVENTANLGALVSWK